MSLLMLFSPLASMTSSTLAFICYLCHCFLFLVYRVLFQPFLCLLLLIWYWLFVYILPGGNSAILGCSLICWLSPDHALVILVLCVLKYPRLFPDARPWQTHVLLPRIFFLEPFVWLGILYTSLLTRWGISAWCGPQIMMVNWRI